MPDNNKECPQTKFKDLFIGPAANISAIIISKDITLNSLNNNTTQTCTTRAQDSCKWIKMNGMIVLKWWTQEEWIGVALLLIKCKWWMCTVCKAVWMVRCSTGMEWINHNLLGISSTNSANNLKISPKTQILEFHQFKDASNKTQMS